MGAGLLFDLGEEADTYRSLIASQGVGSHGVGVLFDRGGDDHYEAEGFSQGAAAWGIGLLLDVAGNDDFRLYNSGQGYGFTRGVGAIVDRAGDDEYVANPGERSLDGDILYPSDQLPGGDDRPTANHSFAQGCGAGHRPDWPDAGFPFPGGIGILRDASGADRYAAGVFGQGVGFVQGLGMLLEGSGNDAYEGLYYVQGVAVHMALGLFIDRGGEDRYDLKFPNQGASLGLANDLSAAIAYDADGKDLYQVPPLSMGASLANGISIFADDGGEDRFDAPAPSVCAAAITGDVNAKRQKKRTLGIFVKARGDATYKVDGHEESYGDQCDDDHHGHEDSEVEERVGVNAPKGRVKL